MSDALLDAAIAQFGEHGYAAASTRAIAAQAATAMSTITYRHGGKEGLYLAAASHIAEAIAARLAPALVRGGDDPADRACAIVHGFAVLMMSETSGAWARFIMREQMAPTAAFDRLWDGAMRPAMEEMARCVGEATGETDPAAARLTALTLMGQALIFRAARASVLRALERDALEPDDIAPILARLETNVRAILAATPESR
jgi:AcrR family transcriptional regulator